MDSLKKKGRRGVSEDNIKKAVEILDRIHKRSTGIVRQAKRAHKEITDTGRQLKKRDSGSGSSSRRGLGSFIGELGKCAVNGVSTIANAAVPITTSVLKTSADLVGTVADSAKDVYNTISTNST